MKEIKAEFCKKFGSQNAAAIERAANEHLDMRAFDSNRGYGSDYFRWSLLMAISFECISNIDYANYHGITCDWPSVDSWLKEPDKREWVAAHDGDFDAIALLAGVYNDYVPDKDEVE